MASNGETEKYYTEQEEFVELGDIYYICVYISSHFEVICPLCFIYMHMKTR